MMKLTEKDKKVINMLGHSLYTVEFVEEWLNRPTENIVTNAPAALQQLAVESFVEAIRCMTKLLPVETKCHFPDGITIKPDGVHELDPCTYEEVERYGNVTISVMRCKNCGHVEINWYRQEDTVELETE